MWPIDKLSVEHFNNFCDSVAGQNDHILYEYIDLIILEQVCSLRHPD